MPVELAINKRSASPTEMVASPKRRKTNESFKPSTLQRSELDSAMALASLALDSPKSVAEREAGQSPRVTTSEEERTEAVPITPVAPLTPTNSRKRVHFSEEIPERAVRYSGPPPSRLIRQRRPMMVPQHRPISYIPYAQMHVFRPVVALPPAYRHHMMFRPWIPRQSAFVPPHAVFARPRAPFPVVSSPAASTWICDFCNSASFSSYAEACAHESECKRRVDKNDTKHEQTRQPGKTTAEEETAVRDESVSTNWFAGSVALAVESADREWLSELNCYLRKHCIEAFSATKQDILRSSKRGRISLDQVGIRCKFCAHRPLSEKAVAAVSYPTSTAGIYESVKRWQRVHLPACLDVGDDTQAILDKFQNDSVWVPTTRQYWTDSALALGMVDTTDGIRFEREPSEPDKNWMPETAKPTVGLASSVSSAEIEPCTSSTQPQSGGFICLPDDQESIPRYVYFLLRQVEPCYFTEADRFVARSKGPVGFAGFQCRHCQGHAGLGKYFPLNSKALSTNSTSQNIHAHVLKCRKCPRAVKEELVSLKNEKNKSTRLVPGWRKTFFERLWERLHGDEVNI